MNENSFFWGGELWAGVLPEKKREANRQV